MLEYVIALFLLMSIYNEVKFFLIKRKINGPQKIKRGAEPYFHKKGKIGVLLIHGFTSTPRDFRYLTRYLVKKNITVHCPLLPGHGTSPEHLSLTRWYEWIAELNNSLELLKQHCNKIFIIGSSLGGNMAFIVAEKNKDIFGIISMGTPIRFKKERMGKLILPLLKRIKLFQKKRYPKKLKPLIKTHLSYKVLPIRSAGDVAKVIKKSKEALPNITQPTLIMQSENDETSDNASVFFIRDKIKSKIKEVYWAKKSYHVFIVDKHRGDAIKKIYEFIKKLS